MRQKRRQHTEQLQFKKIMVNALAEHSYKQDHKIAFYSTRTVAKVKNLLTHTKRVARK